MKWYSSAVLIALISGAAASGGKDPAERVHGKNHGKKLASRGKRKMAKKAMAPGVVQLGAPPGVEKDGYHLCTKLQGEGKYDGFQQWLIGQQWTLQNELYPGNGGRSVYYLPDGDPQVGGQSMALYYSPPASEWFVATRNGKRPSQVPGEFPGDDHGTFYGYDTDYENYYYYYKFDDDDSPNGWTWGETDESYKHYITAFSAQTHLMPEYTQAWHIKEENDDGGDLAANRKNFMFKCISVAMGNCYHGSSTVSVLNTDGASVSTKISDLKVGDKIMANGGLEHKGKKYGTVIGLPHNPSKKADDFVEITMGKKAHNLRATKHHTFVKCSGETVTSKDIKKGDCLKTEDDLGTGLVHEVKNVPAGDDMTTYSILMEKGVDEIAVGGVFTHSMKTSGMEPKEEKKAGGLRGSA